MPFNPTLTNPRLICTACGTQYLSTSLNTTLIGCPICDDPRQYVPPTGQSFLTTSALRAAHTNTITPYTHASSPSDKPAFYNILTTPKFAIGQRAILIPTPAGNVLWDCLTLLDAETVEKVNALGGIGAIVISHPHYYSAHAEWADAFGCPVYLAAEDARWVAPLMEADNTILVKDQETEVTIGGKATGVKIVKVGGHFPGSLVALYEKRLFVADTLLTTPAGVGDWGERGRPKGMNSFAFMWSIPNSIPLGAEEVWRMWGVLGGLEFTSTHGAFVGQDIESKEAKGRVLESMRIQTGMMKWEGQAKWDSVVL